MRKASMHQRQVRVNLFPMMAHLGLAALLLVANVVTAAPGLAVHPALPSADDEVFVARHEIYCNEKVDVVREPIAGGLRVKVPFGGAHIVFGGEPSEACLQSLGRLGAGRHEIVAVSNDAYAARITSDMEPTIVTIAPGTRPPEVNMWTYEPSTLETIGVQPGQPEVIVRLSGNLFAAIVREADRDGITLFGTAAGDWRRLTDGFPGPMAIDALYSDASDNLYAIAAVRGPGPARAFDRGSGPRSIWRLDPSVGVWQRYVDWSYERGSVATIMSGGRIITVSGPFGASRLNVYQPETGWKQLPGILGQTTRGLARTGADQLYALMVAPADQGNRFLLGRISLESGAIVETVPLSLGGASPIALHSGAGGMLLIISREYSSVTPFAEKYTLLRGDPADGSSWLQLFPAVTSYPFAPAIDGSFLAIGKDYVARFQKGDGPSVAIANGGLAAHSVCGDVTAGPSGVTTLHLCNGTTSIPFSMMGLLPFNSLSVSFGGGVNYTVTGDRFNARTVALARGIVNQGNQGPVIDLTAALGIGPIGPIDPTGLYFGTTATPYHLIAIPNTSRLLLLAHRYINPISVAATVVEIDVAALTAKPLAIPPVLASDMTLSPSGNLYLATRFGEILRKKAGDTAWTTYGHLSTAHIDLHVAVDAAERMYVYGGHGVAREQGAGTRVEEFHHSGLDHYFMTADPLEAAQLRAQPALGWIPTGQSFPAIGTLPYPTLPMYAPVSPACRFYGSVTPGPNSHFYTNWLAECEGLKTLARQTPDNVPRWNYEGIAFHALSAFLPARCADTEQQILRYFNGGSVRGLEPNHRYVQGAAAKAQMVAAGWAAENVAFCVPNNGITRTYQR